jgi:hypothetical protein
MKLIRLLGCVSLVTIIVLHSAPAQITATSSGLSYDLLLLSASVESLSYDPQDTIWTNRDQGTLALNYFDTQTGELTQVETTDMPLNQEALSPDGQYLAVYRDGQVCIVDQHWQTSFCRDMSNCEAWYLCKLGWEPDSQSFWAFDSLSESKLSQIGVPEGEVLRSVQLENDSAQQGEVWDVGLFPAAHVALLRYAWSNFNLYDLETGSFLYELNYLFFVSPDARYAACRGEAEALGAIFSLEDPDLNPLGGIPVLQINSQTTWSTTSELAWNKGDERWQIGPFAYVWSHDSRKVAIYRSIVQDGRTIGLTEVYFLDTQEVRVLRQTQWEIADLYWSPDDSALVVLPANTGYPLRSGTEVTILTLDGSTIPVLNEDQLFRVYSITWLPHGWLAIP